MTSRAVMRAVDARLDVERAAGRMNALPETVEFRRLAAAILMRAFDDLRDPEERADAEEFLRVTAWLPQGSDDSTPWAAILELDRETVIGKVDAIVTRIDFFKRSA